MNRRIAVLLVLAVIATACAPEEAVESTHVSDESTTRSTTARRRPPCRRRPRRLSRRSLSRMRQPDLTADDRRLLCIRVWRIGSSRRLIPEPVLASITPAPVNTPDPALPRSGTFKGKDVATVEMRRRYLSCGQGCQWLEDRRWQMAESVLAGTIGARARVWWRWSVPTPDQERRSSRTRTDSIHFVGLDGAGAGGIVGVPRDSWVPIAGGGRSKINAALSWAGPEGMMQTFQDLSGLPLEGYVMTGFAGFSEMIGVGPRRLRALGPGSDARQGIEGRLRSRRAGR